MLHRIAGLNTRVRQLGTLNGEEGLHNRLQARMLKKKSA
jgi:hypothetical protein